MESHRPESEANWSGQENKRKKEKSQSRVKRRIEDKIANEAESK